MRRTIPLTLVLLATLSPGLSLPDPSSMGAAWAAEGSGNGNGNGNIGDNNGNGNSGNDNGNGNVGSGLGNGNATDGNGNGVAEGVMDGAPGIADPVLPSVGGAVSGAIPGMASQVGLGAHGPWHVWPGGRRHRHGDPAFDLNGRPAHGFRPARFGAAWTSRAL